MSRCIAVMSLMIACGLTVIVVSSSAQGVAQIESTIAGYVEEGHFMCSVLVARSGEVVYKGGAGMANREWDIPNAADTKFRLVSITKQFTAVLVLQLAEQGALDLDDTISDHLSDYRKDTGKTITIHHLLTHTSGLPNYTALPGFFKDDSRDPYSVDDFVEQFCSGDLEFEPGKRWRYSNSGYFVLGAIVEAVAGKTYNDLLRERIFDPLGMSDTGYDEHGEILKQRATGYTRRDGALRNSPYLDMSLPYAAGALYSTVEDLYKWDRALYTDALLSPKMKKQMFTAHKQDYGYGWSIREQKVRDGDERVTTIGHGGGINGFSTAILRAPDDQHLVVVLGNLDSSRSGPLSIELLNLLYGDER